MHSSDVLVSPSGTAPASRSRATVGASRSARKSRRLTRPAALGRPSAAKDSLIVHGTPCSGGRAPGDAAGPAAAARGAAERPAAVGAGGGRLLSGAAGGAP